jgi:hypothetical protein
LIRRARRALEWLLGRWYEGPEVPWRLIHEVRIFAKWRPRATRMQWARFAAGLAEECYKAGYMRGVEYVERGELSRQADPDAVADQIDPGWRHRPAVDLSWDELDAAMQTAPDVPDDDLADLWRR